MVQTPCRTIARQDGSHFPGPGLPGGNRIGDGPANLSVTNQADATQWT